VRGLFLPQIEASYPGSLPSHSGTPRRRKLRHHHIVHSAGTVADQQLPRPIPANNQAHMGSARVQRKVFRLAAII